MIAICHNQVSLNGGQTGSTRVFQIVYVTLLLTENEHGNDLNRIATPTNLKSNKTILSLQI